MDHIKNALRVVMIKRLNFANASMNSKIDNRTLDKQDVVEFLDSLDNFYKTLTVSGIGNFKTFIQTYNKELDVLKSTLATDDKKFFEQVYTNNLSDHMKSIHDAIFGRMKYNRTIKVLEQEVTKTFTEFTKGITFFRSEFQDERYPNYHRDASCGSKNQKSYQRFVKTLYGPKNDEYIKRCLIERLIYDKLYEGHLRLQDIAHTYELQEVKILYEKYFPNLSLKISMINYNDEKKPVSVSIEYHNKDGLAILERYSKPIDNADVYCIKQYYQIEEYYEKIQNFDNHADWIRMRIPAVPLPKYRITFE